MLHGVAELATLYGSYNRVQKLNGGDASFQSGFHGTYIIQNKPSLFYPQSNMSMLMGKLIFSCGCICYFQHYRSDFFLQFLLGSFYETALPFMWGSGRSSFSSTTRVRSLSAWKSPTPPALAIAQDPHSHSTSCTHALQTHFPPTHDNCRPTKNLRHENNYFHFSSYKYSLPKFPFFHHN